LLDRISSGFISVAQVTPEQVAAAVAKVVASEQGALQERRYLFNQNILVGKVRCAAMSGRPSSRCRLASRARQEAALSLHVVHSMHSVQRAAICQVRSELKWAEVSAVKAEVEQQVAALLGPRTEEDAAAAAAPKKKVCSPSRPALCTDQPNMLLWLV
jgi:hypothetical protein